MYEAQLAKSNTAPMPPLSMEATAAGLDVPNPWSASSAALIHPAESRGSRKSLDWRSAVPGQHSSGTKEVGSRLRLA